MEATEIPVRLYADTLIVPDIDGVIAYGQASRKLARLSGNEPTINEYIALKQHGFFREIFHMPISSPTVERVYKSLMLLCTRQCNLRCIYCYASATGNGQHMSVATAIEATQFYIAHTDRTLRVSFHGGGEPTLNMPVIHAVTDLILREATNRPTSFSIVTNGTADEKTLDWLIEKRFSFSLSWDGPPDIQNRNRPFIGGRGSANNLERTAEYLNAKNYPFFVRATLSPIDDVEKTLSYFARFGVKHLHIEPLFPHGREYPSLKFGQEASQAVYAPEAKDLIYMTISALNTADRLGISVDNSAIKNRLPRFRIGRFCGNIAAKSMVVTHDGRLTSCTEVIDMTDAASKIFFYGMGQTLESDCSMLNNILTRHTKNQPQCSVCPFRYSCGGGCAVKAYRQTGEFLGIDPVHCQYIKIIVPQLIKREATRRKI